MRFLIVVGSSPWGSSVATAALRFAHAVLGGGDELRAVFFNGDGVYNALPGDLSDGGMPGPQAGWAGLAEEHGVDLFLCPAARARRVGRAARATLPSAFREGGLAALCEMMDECDRVVSF